MKQTNITVSNQRFSKKSAQFKKLITRANVKRLLKIFIFFCVCLIIIFIPLFYKYHYMYRNYRKHDIYQYSQTRKRNDTSPFPFVANIHYPQYAKRTNLFWINDWSKQNSYTGNKTPQVYAYGNISNLRSNDLLNFARRCPINNIIIPFNKELANNKNRDGSRWTDYRWGSGQAMSNSFSHDIIELHHLSKRIFLSFGGWFDTKGLTDIWNLAPSAFILEKLIEDNILYYGASGLDFDLENDPLSFNQFAMLCLALKKIKQRLNSIHYSLKIQLTLFGPSNDTTGNVQAGQLSPTMDSLLYNSNIRDYSIVFMNNQATNVDQLVKCNKNLKITSGSLTSLEWLWNNRARFVSLRKYQSKYLFMHRFGICFGSGFKNPKTTISAHDAVLLSERLKKLGVGMISIWQELKCDYNYFYYKPSTNVTQSYAIGAQLINFFQENNSWSTTNNKINSNNSQLLNHLYYKTKSEISLQWNRVNNATFYGIYLLINNQKPLFLKTVLQTAGGGAKNSH